MQTIKTLKVISENNGINKNSTRQLVLFWDIRFRRDPPGLRNPPAIPKNNVAKIQLISIKVKRKIKKMKEKLIIIFSTLQ